MLAYLYNFTDPDSTIRDNTKAALCKWANQLRLSGGLGSVNAQLMERFLTRLEEELRRDANKSLLPYFADIRSDIANAKSELKEEVGKVKEEIDEANHKYRTVIINEAGKELRKHNFTLQPDDAFLLEANHFLENDGWRDYLTPIVLESDRSFTRRLGNYFYRLIMGADGGLRDKVNGVLEKGFQFVLALDTEAELLWQVPWEYLHDSEEFVGLSGKVHIVRAPKGFGRVQGSAIAPPLKILVVVSNPGGEGEFDSERALAAIQEAVDYGRRMGWVELDYLEDATFANFQSRLAGVGTALLRERLPALVVMQYSVLVDTAIQFAKVFYEQIGRGESLSHALTHVRQVLAKSRGEHRADWGIPALYLRLPQLQLVDPRAPKLALSNVEGRDVLSEVEGVNIGDLPVVAGFVGRTRELRQLRETVRHPQQPVIYIWGLGGIGKTSLTAKLIEKLEQERAIENRLVIRCDNIEPTFAAVAEKLGTFISLQGKAGHAEAGLALQDSRYDIATRVALLNNAIKEQRYLIVFDNFESLFSEKAPQIGRLADASLQEFFKVLFNHNWRSTFLFTCRYQWDLLTDEPGMNRFTCNLPLANCLLLHLQGLSPAQTRMLMKNLPALRKLTFNQQNQVLPLLLGHPHTIRLFDDYLKQYGLDAVLQDEMIIGTGAGGGQPSAPTIIIEKLGEYFLDGLWSRLNDAEKDVLGLLSVFRASLTEEGLAQLITAPQALIALLNYALLQRETGEDGPSYQVHPVVRGYVESKLGAEKMKGYHLQSVEFYVSRHEDILSQFKLFLDMLGRREITKALLQQSIASLESHSKYVAKGNLATLLNYEGKWQEAIATSTARPFFGSAGKVSGSSAVVQAI